MNLFVCSFLNFYWCNDFQIPLFFRYYGDCCDDYEELCTNEGSGYEGTLPSKNMNDVKNSIFYINVWGSCAGSDCDSQSADGNCFCNHFLYDFVTQISAKL